MGRKKPLMLTTIIATVISVFVFGMVNASYQGSKSIDYEMQMWDEFIFEPMIPIAPYDECEPEVLVLPGDALLSEFPDEADDTDGDGIPNNVPIAIEMMLSGSSKCLGPIRMYGGGSGEYNQKFTGAAWPAEASLDKYFYIEQQSNANADELPLILFPCYFDGKQFIELPKHEEGLINNFPPDLNDQFYAEGPIDLCAYLENEPKPIFSGLMYTNVGKFSS